MTSHMIIGAVDARAATLIVAAAEETAGNGAALQHDNYITGIICFVICAKDLGDLTAGHSQLDAASHTALTTAIQAVGAAAVHLHRYFAVDGIGGLSCAVNIVHVGTVNGQFDISVYGTVVTAAIQTGMTVMGGCVIGVDCANIHIAASIHLSIISAAINARIVLAGIQIVAAQQFQIRAGNILSVAAAIQVDIGTGHGDIFIDLQAMAICKVTGTVFQDQLQIVIGNRIALAVVMEAVFRCCSIARRQIQHAAGDGNILFMVFPHKAFRRCIAIQNPDCTAICNQLQRLIQALNRRCLCTGIGVQTGIGHIDNCVIRSSCAQGERTYQQNHSSQYEQDSFLHNARPPLLKYMASGHSQPGLYVSFYVIRE